MYMEHDRTRNFLYNYASSVNLQAFMNRILLFMAHINQLLAFIFSLWPSWKLLSFKSRPWHYITYDPVFLLTICIHIFMHPAGIMTFCCSWYVFGKTAEAVGENCCLYSLAYMSLFNPCVREHVRERIRQKKDLKASWYMHATNLLLVCYKYSYCRYVYKHIRSLLNQPWCRVFNCLSHKVSSKE